jgi:uncharacterized phage protein (TIGR01671 family)
MHPIKCRVWNDEYQQMFYSDKDYDDCFFGFDKGIVVAWFRKTIEQTQDEPAYDVGEPCADVMQYTGLHDKNGKERYCGDIETTEDGGIYEIIWLVDYAGFFWRIIKPSLYEPGKFAKEKGDYVPLGRQCSTIIGNVYENPELLEGKDENS